MDAIIIWFLICFGVAAIAIGVLVAFIVSVNSLGEKDESKL